MMRAERIRGALILAAAFLLAAAVGLAMAVSFDDNTSRPIAGAALPMPAVPPPTMAVDDLAALHGRPPVKPLARRRQRQRQRQRRPSRVVAVAAAATAPAPRRVLAAPRPVAPAPEPAPAKKQAPVVFDDSA
jgi:hypothetical protein